MAYTKEKTQEEFKDALIDIKELYKKPFVNWKGKTTTNEYYSEILAVETLKELKKFDAINKTTRGSNGKSYYTENHHDGIKLNKTNRQEENFAKRLYELTFDKIGKIIDYQIPLKDSANGSEGKIDLISLNKDTLYLIELKYGNNQETLYRAMIESFTYSKIVDKKKLISDYQKVSAVKVENVKPAVMVVKTSTPICNSYKELIEMEKTTNRSKLKELAVALAITFLKCDLEKLFS